MKTREYKKENGFTLTFELSPVGYYMSYAGKLQEGDLIAHCETFNPFQFKVNWLIVDKDNEHLGADIESLWTNNSMIVAKEKVENKKFFLNIS